MLHERHALALDRARDERLRAIADLAERLERVAKLADVVAVAGRDVPAEGTEPRLELAERDDLVRRLVRLELVAIDDDRKARQALVRGGLEPFVVLTLLQLAVADHDDDPTAAAEVPLRPRDPAALRDAHPERAGVGLDPGDADVRMTVEPTEPAQPQQPLARDHAERVERRVEPWHVVPLRGEVHVAIGEAQPTADVFSSSKRRNATTSIALKRRAEMTRAGALHGDERVQPAHVGEKRESVVRGEVGGPDPIELGLRRQAQVGHRAGSYPSRCGVTTSERSAPSRSSSVFSHRKSASVDPGR